MKIILVRSRSIDSAVFKLAETLSKNGHSVTLLVWDRQNNLKRENKGYNVHRFSLRAPYDKWTALFYLPLWWIYEFYFLLIHNADVIHACDFDTLWPAVIAKFIKKFKLFYIIYDFYADNLIKLPEFVRKTIAFLEKSGIKFSDTLFLVDESRYEQVKGAKIKKLIYIYNSPPDYSITHETGIPNDNLVIFYAGLLDKSRGLEYIIATVKELEFTKLIIAGNGNYKNVIEKESELTKNITYLGWLNHDDVLEISFQADVLFAFYDPIIPNNKYASPNKLFESMMCGKPIIMNSETSASKIVQNEDCGITVNYGDIKSIKDALIKLQSPDLREKLGKNGRRAYETKYSWKIMEERLVKSYDCEVI
ncbi:glycosyltransferase family 4 protein [Methanobacterium paludis]|uniref:Glycosyl transferase group 1 n=1 Tax=Methanobacterium paludis (strain DSM 25820 / JCM 18151 / SWAN1) TaxID=868131 RepID=F6D714_METPW|nr:glycosyltransferase family 4 protein [Methanobacterium paludis]AEG18381.1 glycosyl transferase group 1 [Methanobacterium paludis]